jgi:hypothetical protein
MRMRLWRRRLTISAPRMAIRSAIPWPLRWLAVAVVLGLSAVVALWAFEFGRDVAGLDPLSGKALAQLREENERLRTELATVSAVANTADSLLTAERAAQAQLVAQIRRLEAESQSLKNELAFFGQLLTPGRGSEVAVRGLQARRSSATEVVWRTLLVQAAKHPAVFKGGIEVSYRGTLQGAAWTMTEPASQHPVSLGQSLKLEGRSVVPQGAVVKNITVRVMLGSATKSMLTADVVN